jgi:hypothetical protein
MAVPPLDLRSDTVDGKPVTIIDYQFQAVAESPGQAVTVVFDAANLPVREERRSLDEWAGWTTKTIEYQLEFVDRSSLPPDFFDEVAAATEPLRELAEQGFDVRWLGPTYKATTFDGESTDLRSEAGQPPQIEISYSGPPDGGNGPYHVLLTETPVTGWPSLQSIFPALESVETTGEPVDGIGDRAYLLPALEPGFGSIVVFDADVVVVIAVGMSESMQETTRRELLAAAQALQPFTAPEP